MLDDFATTTTAYTPRDEKSFPTRRHKLENTLAVQGMNIEILPPEGKIKDFWPTCHLQKRSPSLIRTPHQMRVANLHEPGRS